MSNNILSNNKILYSRFSRRDFLFLLTSLPLINSFQFKNKNFNIELKEIIGHRGVITLANVETGKIIGCTGLNSAIIPNTIGSIAKLVSATALLEKGILTSKDSYYCKGYEIINNKKVECWNPNGHGLLTIESAISESCNLFFRNFSKKIASEDIIDYFNIFKLNTPELAKEKPYKTDINFSQAHLNTDIALGLDDKIRLNALQLLSLACTLARNGTYKPLWLEIDPNEEEHLPIKNSNLSIIRNGMIHCGLSGTAELLHKKGFKAAAKTGTAPSDTNHTHGWCIGFTPIKQPALAFSVFIKNGTGFSNAVPIAAKTLKLCKNYNYL